MLDFVTPRQRAKFAVERDVPFELEFPTSFPLLRRVAARTFGSTWSRGSADSAPGYITSHLWCLVRSHRYQPDLSLTWRLCGLPPLFIPRNKLVLKNDKLRGQAALPNLRMWWALRTWLQLRTCLRHTAGEVRVAFRNCL